MGGSSKSLYSFIYSIIGYLGTYLFGMYRYSLWEQDFWNEGENCQEQNETVNLD